MTFQEFDDLIKRYIQGKCSEEEKRLVEKWYASLEDNEQGTHESHHQLLLERRLWERIAQKTPASKQRFMYAWRAGSIAATLLLIAISLFMYFNRNVPAVEQKAIAEHHSDERIIHNTEQDIKKIVLADGSAVLLEPGSELKYYPASYNASREVHLTGEAFFEIIKDTERPFRVYTNNLMTKVLGTTFRIKAYQQEKEIVVSVATGKVSVSRQVHQKEDPEDRKDTAQEMILLPNQQAVYNKNEDKVAMRSVDDLQRVLPRPAAKIHYSNVSVTTIFDTLEKTHNITIKSDKAILSNCTVTTTLSGESLYETIEIICQAIGASYEVHDSSVIIESQGCE